MTSPDEMAMNSGWAEAYAPKCLEGEFCELPLYGVLRSSSEAPKITHLDHAPGGRCLLAWRVIQTLGGARHPALYVKEVGQPMYVAVRRYEGMTDPQRVAEVAQEGFVPMISEMSGFVAYYLVDAGDGVTVSSSIFEHKDAEEQSNFVAGEVVAEHL